MKKIIINKKYYGKIELAKTRNAYKVFVAVVKAFSANEKISIKTIYPQKKIDSFAHYQNGGCEYELLEIDMFIELGKLLKFSTDDAQKLKKEIEFVNDNAHVNLPISKSLKLFNKETPTPCKKNYLFLGYRKLLKYLSHVL